MLVITFRRRPCNRPPPPEAKIVQSFPPPEAEKDAIICSAYQNFQGPSAPEKTLDTLIFAFYCSFKKQFFRKVTFRKPFRNQSPKTLSGKNFLTPYTQNFDLYFIFKKQFSVKSQNFSKTAPSAQISGALHRKSCNRTPS